MVNKFDVNIINKDDIYMCIGCNLWKSEIEVKIPIESLYICYDCLPKLQRSLEVGIGLLRSYTKDNDNIEQELTQADGEIE